MADTQLKRPVLPGVRLVPGVSLPIGLASERSIGPFAPYSTGPLRELIVPFSGEPGCADELFVAVDG